MKLPSGATIAPLILSSDKTQLTQFQGDKKAWPVYLTIGNLSKKIRRQPSTHGTILVGYLPVAKLYCFSEGSHSLQGYRLFHHCMEMIFGCLIEAGTRGVDMVCADRWIRRVCDSCSICGRLSGAVSGGLLYGKPLSLLYS